MLKLFLFLYSALWRLALPILRRQPRLADGWEQRTLATLPHGAEKGFDLWIQSASGGESLLSRMVLAELAETHSGPQPLRVLATSFTREGLETLKKLPTSPNLQLTCAFFPFDAPALTRRAFATFRPKAAVLVETELWPGWLIAAKEAQVPVLLINGRLSEKSCRSYRRLRRFFYTFGPQRVLAMSETDAERFASILPAERVRMVPNIKFDRMEFERSAPPFAFRFTPPVVVLGSVREEEEEAIITCTKLLQESRATISLFPKHPRRAPALMEKLAAAGLPARLRSQCGEEAEAASLLVWDSFGELAAAFSRADAAFVGGSLCSWGGHNFLEPLAFGMRPIIGRNWKNFAWIGREVVESGLVEEVDDEQQLAARLLHRLAHPDDPAAVQREAAEIFTGKRGGTATTCEEICTLLATQNHTKNIKEQP